MRYTCSLCNKEFSQKSNYDAHNNKKFKCNIKVVNKDVNDNIHNATEIPPNTTKIPPNTTNKIISNITSEISCNYCNKIFTRKDALTRHINNRCKAKKNYNEQIDQIFNELTKLKDENEELKNEINPNEQQKYRGSIEKQFKEADARYRTKNWIDKQ
jgi:uncharacterized coiled-coil DUF342 family protein